MSPLVWLVTCAALPEGDEDELGLLVEACADVGLDARWAVWDDPGIDWTAGALSVVRSTWDYTARRAEFLAWTRRVPRLHNPAPVLAWNSDKTYLRELAAAGLPIVPTAWVAPGEPADLPIGRDFVLKPAVGAGSRGAGRFGADDPDVLDRARAHLAHLHDAGRTVMVQPYLDRVDDRGETGLIFIAGEFSHAIGKAAMLPRPVIYRVDDRPARELFVDEHITARTPTAAELDVARAVLAAVPDTVRGADELLYARVDLLPGPDGPVLIELELTEPSLYLQHSTAAPARLARAIGLWVDGQRV